jgi:hypothetical protein
MGRDTKRLEPTIRERLSALRRALAASDDSALVVWVIDGELACAQRPLRDHPKYGGKGPLPASAKDAVVAWVQRVSDLGFRSIICLSHPKELEYYAGLDLHPRGLLGYYEANGLAVRHLPWLDPAHARTPEERARRMAQVDDIKHEAKAAFEALPKPVLLHCSAGIDRSPPVAAFIAEGRVASPRATTVAPR